MSADLGDYQRRALEHRPREIVDIRAAIDRMRADGHGDHTIADALGLNVNAVRRLAGCQDCG